jgi:hypothetical protein
LKGRGFSPAIKTPPKRAALAAEGSTRRNHARPMCNVHLDPPRGSKKCLYSFFRLFPTEVSSRPKRTRISCHAAPEKVAFAPFRKEGRMACISATKFHRKSGGAKWRDLRFRGPLLEMFFRPERSGNASLTNHIPPQRHGGSFEDRSFGAKLK